MKQLTFAMIKPHIVKNSVVVSRIMNTINIHFKIVQIEKFQMSEELASAFYSEHAGRFYFDRLLQSMCSGPALALILEGENSIQRWREEMGPTKTYRSIYTHPNSIRSLYGLSDTRNVCHGADSINSAKREISLVFPCFKYKNYLQSLSS